VAAARKTQVAAAAAAGQENVYCEIGAGGEAASRGRLEAVPEEEEEEEEEESEEGVEAEERERWEEGGQSFWVRELRHVDSDVNTEEEELYVAQVRQLSSRYLPAGKVTSL